MVSSLRGGALVIFVPPIVVPPVTTSSRVVDLSRSKFECLEESLTSLGELSCRLPFEMGFAGLFFPFFESPGDFSSRVIGGGCCGRSPRHLETQSKPPQVPQEPPLNQAIAKWLFNIFLNPQQSLVNDQQPKRIFNHVTLGNPHHVTYKPSNKHVT